MFSTFAALSGLAFFLGLRTTGLAIVVLSILERSPGLLLLGWHNYFEFLVLRMEPREDPRCKPKPDGAAPRRGARHMTGHCPSHLASHKADRHLRLSGRAKSWPTGPRGMHLDC